MTPDNQNGNISTFTELVNQLQGLVYNTVLGIVQNETDAEDVTQEVFIQVHESLPGFKGDSKLSTWVYRIAVNKALDFKKSKTAQRHGGWLKRVFSTTEAEEPAVFYHPGVALENKEEAAVLFKAIDQLPEKQRVAFLLHKTEAMPYAEIAEVLETSVHAVESLMGRAKQNLKNYLHNYYLKNKL
ncbi:MAG TPA: RNA polymerase sigma factor [Ferruginibacter sp.]|nr:RNA polymerase sigma factor [Ferruginibacter sp.]